MKKNILPAYKVKFESIKKMLTIIGCKESNFIKVELLFYEAMSTARQFSDDADVNELLLRLKQLEENDYQQTKTNFKKSSQREQVIRRFINQFKIILSAGIKDGTRSSQVTA